MRDNVVFITKALLDLIEFLNEKFMNAENIRRNTYILDLSNGNHASNRLLRENARYRPGKHILVLL